MKFNGLGKEVIIKSLKAKYARYLRLSANLVDNDEYLEGLYDGKMRMIQECIAIIKMMED